jgi:uncharacterized protein YhbP (UPF0306 family)
MNKLEKRIIDFIKEHHVLTMATSKNNQPYCANCFYAYLEDENAFVFTSDMDTKHIKDALEAELRCGLSGFRNKSCWKNSGNSV